LAETYLHRGNYEISINPNYQVSNESNKMTDTELEVLMVVDPDVLVRMALAEYLRECGYKVIEGITAEDAWSVLQSGRKPDLILSDVQLPGATDGFQLAKRIREAHPDIQVILTSSAAKAAERAGDLCDEGPLPKPYHHEDVLRRIRLLRAKGKRDQS
jgi:CheY-like chemotaxis protein